MKNYQNLVVLCYNILLTMITFIKLTLSQCNAYSCGCLAIGNWHYNKWFTLRSKDVWKIILPDSFNSNLMISLNDTWLVSSCILIDWCDWQAWPKFTTPGLACFYFFMLYVYVTYYTHFTYFIPCNWMSQTVLVRITVSQFRGTLCHDAKFRMLLIVT